MIAYLKGILTEKSPTRLVVEASGVGYEVLVPLSTSERLPEVGKSVQILTYHHVREDSIQLFGFASVSEREVFEILLTVKGIGPKVALGILSGSSVERFKEAVAAGDADALTAIPGIGKKTSQRIVLELREKFGPPIEGVTAPPLAPQAGQAIAALVTLGVFPQKARSVIAGIAQKGKDLSAEEMIRRALSEI